jgi:hypothetical protein
MVLSIVDLLVVKTFVVLRAGVTESVVIRMVRLNQYLAGTIAASGASGDLSDQLKRPLR